MFLENTKEARMVKNVAASMVIEEMYFSREFIHKALEVSEGKGTAEDAIKEVIQKYGRP